MTEQHFTNASSCDVNSEQNNSFFEDIGVSNKQSLTNEISENSSSGSDLDENENKKNLTSKDRSNLLEKRVKKLKLNNLSFHPDSALRKKSSIFYFELHGMVKNMIDKSEVYKKLCSFDVNWKKNRYISKPKTLIVDLRTSCEEYLEEQNVKELYSVQDILYVYLDFDTQVNFITNK